MHYIMDSKMINKSNERLSVIDDFSFQLPVAGKYCNEFALYYLQENASYSNSYQMTDTFCIIVVYSGSLNIMTDAHRYSLSRGDIAFIPPGKTLSLDLNISPIEGYMMAFSSGFFELLQIPIAISKDKLLVKDNELDSEEVVLRKINQIFELIKDELSNNNDDLFTKEKLLNLVSVFYIEILNAYAKSSPVANNLCKSSSFNRKNKICKDFFILVNQYLREERNLKFYADKLCISPKHLSLLIKETTGLSANRLITDAVIHEAKRLLQHSGNSVKEISYLLNFPNQSFFGKYFKREVGLSPSNYQNKMFC